MKDSFDGRLETFRRSLNALTLLNCGVRDHYDRAAAAVELQRLSQAWCKSEDYVIEAIAQEAQREADARLRFQMEQAAKKLNVPLTTEKFRGLWAKLTRSEQIQLADTAIARMQSLIAESM